MSKRVTNISSMEQSAEEERRRRTRNYLLTMAIRTACVASLVFVRGPWLWVVAAGAIVLPWIAVVLANHVQQRRLPDVERPDERALIVRTEPITVEDWYQAHAEGENGTNGKTDTDSEGRNQS